MKYNIDISVMDVISYTVETASCVGHAKDLAIEMLKQDYPDLSFAIVDWECVDD